MKLYLSLLLLILFSCSCNGLKYESDMKVTLSSGAAEYPNFPAKVQGKTCKNSDEELGSCMINLFENENLEVVFPKRPYTYKLDVVCSSRIDFSPFYNVGEDQEFKVTIPNHKYNNLSENQSYFLCTFLIIPNDGRKAVSAITRLFVNVYRKGFRLPDSQAGYVHDCKRGDKCKGKWLYTGVNTRYAYYKKNYKKKPYIKFKDESTFIGESDAMRFVARWY